MILEIFIETLKIVPLLFVVYFLVEIFENKYSDSLKHKLQKIGKYGPILGSLFGALPQCGFSVIGTTLFLSGYLSLGTLISIFLATSDEALPILLSDSSKASLVLPLIIYKIIYATFIGLLVDTILPKFKTKKQVVHDKTQCCSHHPLFSFHPLVHTLKLFAYLFSISLFLEYMFKFIPKTNLLNHFSAALIGLVPNCAASVFITQLFVKNGISFGVLMSGLFASAGLGILVLFKENKNFKQSLFIIFLLYIFSVIGGYLFN